MPGSSVGVCRDRKLDLGLSAGRPEAYAGAQRRSAMGIGWLLSRFEPELLCVALTPFATPLEHIIQRAVAPAASQPLAPKHAGPSQPTPHSRRRVRANAGRPHGQAFLTARQPRRTSPAPWPHCKPTQANPSQTPGAFLRRPRGLTFLCFFGAIQRRQAHKGGARHAVLARR